MSCGRGPMLEAVALLRGNTSRRLWCSMPTEGVQVDFRPVSLRAAEGHARRAQPQAGLESIFILDCSNSMSEPTDMEGPGGMKKVSRLEAAKIALHEMLSRNWRPRETPVSA